MSLKDEIKEMDSHGWGNRGVGKKNGLTVLGRIFVPDNGGGYYQPDYKFSFSDGTAVYVRDKSYGEFGCNLLIIAVYTDGVMESMRWGKLAPSVYNNLTERFSPYAFPLQSLDLLPN